MASLNKVERVAAGILAGTAAAWGTLVVVSLVAKPRAFIANLGFGPNQTDAPLAWILAALVVTYYVWGAAQIPSVREHMFRPTPLKLLAVLAGVMAASAEEVIFRKWIMDYLDKHTWGMALQVIASGVAFGLAHAMWGLFGRNFSAALQAMVATGLLGAALGVVYLAADRNLAPCVIAHFVITALIEPGLMVGGLRGELGFRQKPGDRSV
jgi:membrane protease YdiL (CAAX protease family)